MGHLVDMRLDRDPCLMAVIRRYGTAQRLASALGLTRQAIASWDMVPAKWIKPIADHTGMHPYRIRPDLYVEGYWNMGMNTAEISAKMRLSEPEVDRYLHLVLARRRAGQNDNACTAIPPVSEPPLAGQ
jgi:hypothetical protein